MHEFSQALDEAQEFYTQRKYSRAAVPARSAYALACQHLPPDHPQRRESARLLGLLLLNLNQKEEAQRLLQESGDVGEELGVVARTTQAGLLLQQGKLEEAMEMASDTLEMASQEFGAKSHEAVLVASVVGQVYEHMGDLEQAHMLFQHIVKLRREGEHEAALLAHALLDLGRIYLRCGHYAECEPIYQEVLQLQGDETDLGMAVTLNQYGAVCRALGRREEAIRHLERSLELRRSILGPDHAQVATALHGLAAVYNEQEDYLKADETLEMAWRISDRALGPGHPKTLQFLTERGMNLMGMGKSRALEGLKLVRKAQRLAGELPPSEPCRRQIAQFLEMAESLWEKMSADPGS